MILKNAKTLCFPLVCCMALALVFFQAPAQCHADDFEIDVSPNVLNIQSQSIIVTVHTNIAYSLVDGASVELNGVAIDWWKSDDRGYFVAKFSSEEIKGVVTIGEYNTLLLDGLTKGGEAFAGAQDIRVIDITPQGKN